jgi:hypothetical protein
MRHGLLCDELDDITHSYDYGIVPGSAAVFVKDELSNIGRLDLTLLEGVMIVVEVSQEGYMVISKRWEVIFRVYVERRSKKSGIITIRLLHVLHFQIREWH